MNDNEMSNRDYWDRREAGFKAAAEAAKAYAPTPEARLRKLERRYNLINYGDRDAHTDVERATLNAEIAALRAEMGR